MGKENRGQGGGASYENGCSNLSLYFLGVKLCLHVVMPQTIPPTLRILRMNLFPGGKRKIVCSAARVWYFQWIILNLSFEISINVPCGQNPADG
jgi:hypothetical protein